MYYLKAHNCGTCGHPFCKGSEIRSISTMELFYICHNCGNHRIVWLTDVLDNLEKMLAIIEFNQPCVAPVVQR